VNQKKEKGRGTTRLQGTEFLKKGIDKVRKEAETKGKLRGSTNTRKSKLHIRNGVPEARHSTHSSPVHHLTLAGGKKRRRRKKRESLTLPYQHSSERNAQNNTLNRATRGGKVLIKKREGLKDLGQG